MHALLLPLELAQHDGPVDGSGGGLVYAIIVHVFHHADDLAPVVRAGHSDPLAQRTVRVVPILASEILRDNGDGSFLVGICPREISPGQHPRAQGREKSGGNELEASYRW